jgi:hypothetical protein
VLIPLLSPAMMYAWLWIALLSYRELTMALDAEPASRLSGRAR